MQNQKLTFAQMQQNVAGVGIFIWKLAEDPI